MPSGLKKFKIPFDVNKSESQYWLGYICADGNIQYSKEYRVYKVSLFSKDKEIIDKFMNFIGDRCKYHLRKQNGIHEAYISSIQLCEYMINLGITPKKSLTLNPQFNLTKDFIRGYFDGDGSIRKDKKECKITSGSFFFIDRISNYLESLEIYHKIRQKGNAYDICIERAKECEKFLNHIYTNSDIYLERKFQQFVATFGNKGEKELGEFRGSLEVGNPEPSTMNENKVVVKVQRLEGEDSTNNPSKSAQHFNMWIDYEHYKQYNDWYNNHPLNLKLKI